MQGSIFELKRGHGALRKEKISDSIRYGAVCKWIGVYFDVINEYLFGGSISLAFDGSNGADDIHTVDYMANNGARCVEMRGFYKGYEELTADSFLGWATRIGKGYNSWLAEGELRTQLIW